MNIPRLFLVTLTLIFLSVFAASAVNAQGGTLFTVNHNGDTHDANVGDGICADSTGRCTLRAALEENGTNLGNVAQNGINFALPLPATINLTLGELVIGRNVYIAGPGARNLTIQRSSAAGTPNFRIFYVPANAVGFLTVRGLKIRNGRLNTSDGGGFFIEGGNVVRLVDLSITENSANRGGGIHNAGIVEIKRSLISFNSAIANQNGGLGGGIFNDGINRSVLIINSTLTGNTAVSGGAIYNNEGRVSLINGTISHNDASASAGSIANSANGVVNALNTVIGMDISPTISSLSGAFSTWGNNLITDARNSTGFVNGVNSDQVSNGNAINPFLGALADNGGQTDTRALLDGSPAINAGNNCVVDGKCPTLPPDVRFLTDQRKLQRRGETAVDIGAYETRPPTIISFGGILGGFGENNRAGGILLIFTNSATNEKQTRVTNPFGSFTFSVPDPYEAYFLETKPKRAGGRRGLTVFTFDDLPIFSPPFRTFERDGMIISFDEKVIKGNSSFLRK